jgi:hypothetical protein
MGGQYAHTLSLQVEPDSQVDTRCMVDNAIATQDRVFPHYVPNSPIRHSKSDSKEIPRDSVKCKVIIIR